VAKQNIEKIVGKKNMKLAGKWSFLIGLIVAILAGFLTVYASAVALILFVLGLVAGFLNISETESHKFLLGAIALLTGGIASISAISMMGVISTFLSAVLANFIAFVGAVALVVAIKVIFETSKD
jgi:hypothetical protein